MVKAKNGAVSFTSLLSSETKTGAISFTSLLKLSKYTYPDHRITVVPLSQSPIFSNNN